MTTSDRPTSEVEAREGVRARRPSRALGPRLVGVLVGTAASQVVAALAILGLQLWDGRLSDTYALGFQVGSTAFTGVSVGVVYNLAIGRPGFSRWGRCSAAAAAVSVVVGLAFAAFARPDPLVVVIFGVGGAALAAAGVSAVRAACLGHPRLLAGVTIPSNAALLVVTVATTRLGADGWIAEALPSVGWALGAAGTWAVATRSVRRRCSHDVGRAEPDGAGTSRHVTALVLGSATATLAPPLYLAAVSALPAGSASVLLLVSRLLTGVVNLGVNSVLLARYDWESPRRDVSPTTTATGAVGAAGMAVAAVLTVGGAPRAAVVAAGAGLALLVVSAAVTMREVNARAMAHVVMVKSSVDLVLSALCVAALFHRPTAVGFFAAFAVSQAVSIAVGATGLRHRAAAVTGVLSLVPAWWLLLAA